jgi:SAM-dependent methyltransferase
MNRILEIKKNITHSKIFREFHKIKTDRDRWSEFKNDYKIFSSLSGNSRFDLKWEYRYPCLNDKTSVTSFDAHYLYHPAWAARILAETRPSYHIDIASNLNFCSIVSAFIPVKFYDYRPAVLKLKGLSSEKANVISLPFDTNSISSISCMHVIEHIGLGRYGDTLDPEGDIKAILELKRVLAPGGNLLFVVPVGGEAKIIFNAHRIYRYEQVAEYFNDMKLLNFALITDEGDFIDPAYKINSDTLQYGCGCWWFRKNE